MKKILIIGSLNMDVTVYMDVIPAPGETLKADSLLISPPPPAWAETCPFWVPSAETPTVKPSSHPSKRTGWTSPAWL